jgi:hypothetical protein
MQELAFYLTYMTPKATSITSSLMTTICDCYIRQLSLKQIGRVKQIFYAAADQHISGVLADMLEHIAEPHKEAD